MFTKYCFEMIQHQYSNFTIQKKILKNQTKAHQMKIIYFLLPVLFIIACANSVAEKKPTAKSKLNVQNAENGTSTSAASASVKILKNGKTVIEYSPPLPKAVRVTYKSGEEQLMIELNNPDNNINLMGTVNTVASGTYAIGVDDKSVAGFSLVTDGTNKLPTLMGLSKGSLKITLAGQTCSGSFTGTENDLNGNYEISGSFAAVPIRKVAAALTP